MLRIFLKKFLIILSLFLGLILIGAGIFDFLYRADGYQGPSSDHFDGKHFSNITGSGTRKGVSLTEDREEILSWLTGSRPHWQYRSVIPHNVSQKYNGSGVEITIVGHATVLIQIAGVNILTDPIWSDSPSPFSWFSLGRYANPGVDFSDLTRIDAILLSHNHYDHLDIPTLLALKARDNPIIYTGLGNSAYLKRYDLENTKDMDWFDTENFSTGVTLTFVPAEHYSARALSDRYTTLWGGFVIEGAGKRIYFAGDTGYGPFIDTLRSHYPEGFDIGLLPMGAYRPSFIMRNIHMNPREALKLSEDLSIRHAIGIHFSVFELGREGQNEAISDFKLAKKNFPFIDFTPGSPGSSWVYN